ncbi:MAG TPA: hypothetical protein VIC59_09010 [Gemmatimonadota bacterium]|jgi:Mrp family chromosome partitioning ATPase
MSRIHDALKKAEAERRSPVTSRASAPVRVKEAPVSRAPAIQAPPRQLPESELPLARFTLEGEAVLSRSYEEVERLCSSRLAPGLRDAAGPRRVVLVTSLAPKARPADVALALAATLAEKYKLRVALVDCSASGRGAAELFESDSGRSVMSELRLDPTHPGRFMRRSVLQGLFLLTVPLSGSQVEGSRPDGAVAAAVARVLDWCHAAVLAADSVAEDPRVVSLAPLAQATVLVAREPGAALEEVQGRLFLENAPLYAVRELS